MIKLVDGSSSNFLLATADGDGGVAGGSAALNSRVFISVEHGGVGVNAGANDYQGLAVNGNFNGRGDGSSFESVSIRCNYDAAKASNVIAGYMWRPAWISNSNCANVSGYIANPGSWSGTGSITDSLHGFLCSSSIGTDKWHGVNNYGFKSDIAAVTTGQAATGQKKLQLLRRRHSAELFCRQRRHWND